MILLIDNYDSFTFNLYQYLAELGPEVRVVRNDAIDVEAVEDTMANLQGIVVSPGPCTPREAGISVPLIQRFAGRVPILGVCLGHQSIGSAFEGTVIKAPKLMHGKVSEVYHTGTGIFRDLPSPFIATRYHSLIVDRASLPATLEVTAETSDGVIMGLRHREHEVHGVQFHPESILTPIGKDLLANFLSLTQDAPVRAPAAAIMGY
jgi:anthranilate synthase/aminodeoxychorismate synthase-like glutamine amidotransferase